MSGAGRLERARPLFDTTEQALLDDLGPLGSGTVETRRAMSQLVLDNLDAHFAGRPLLTQIK